MPPRRSASPPPRTHRDPYNAHDRPRRDERDDRRRRDDDRRGARAERPDDGHRSSRRDDRRDDRRDSRRDERPDERRRDGPSDRRRPPSPPRRSRSGSPKPAPAAEDPNKGKPNFKPSGLLAAETKTVKAADGTKTVLKYHEPPEARKPPVGWRLYVFKGTEQVGARAAFSCWASADVG
jgi:smad nuclear-interacting protein 1